ncbi:gliding motility-associated C-terminal domain-containing protein [Neolewinella lacunae]|uniref:Gliding motility-associated C-terminal domain-containing protein n=1 Tax=Neolewinella lacunae TaxID=1517758 RepID=A0A923PK70_9BACT|nr:gliding motility-associated C-terminal domain-containing protein [Neolewinella lacunae]MBC6994070.1 gliding motility-associated C-terminal domain-containing protein [Neolewinella lacunae]MDN3636059.1 gliding motility-associated C-terminal domain-containing protein [Neolewinella lacunae]
MRFPFVLRLLFCCSLLAVALPAAWGQRCGYTDTIQIGNFGETPLNITIADYLNNDLANPNQGLCGVRLYFQHSYVYDLSIRLTSPAGQSIVLTGPINGQTRPPTNLARWFIDFLACDSTAAPDPGAPAQWNNNAAFNWAAFGLYTGDYFPASGCFADLNTGPVNGNWTITFDNQRTGQQGRATYLLLTFCDDRNAQGPCCFADAGELLPVAPSEACEFSTNLPITPTPRYRQPRPPAEEYGYTYLISRNDSALFVQDNPNLAGLPAGEYEICGLSYRLGELDQLRLDGSLSPGALRQDFAAVDPTFCGDLTPNCQRVTLYPIPDTTFLERTVCIGGSVRVGTTDFNTTGVFPVTLAGRADCDSVVVLDLRVVDVLRTTLDTTICAEANYPQGPNVYALPGTYVDTLTSFLGCDSIVTLNLSIAPPIRTDTTTAICAGEAFFIGSEAFTSTGTFTRVLPAVNGCDSTVNLDLLVLNPDIVFAPYPAALTCNTPSAVLDATGSNLAFTQSIRWLNAAGDLLRTDLVLPTDTAGTYIFELTVGTRGQFCTLRDTIVLPDLRFRVGADLALTQVQCTGTNEQCAILSCVNPSLGIGATPTPTGPAYTYAWTAPPTGNVLGPLDGPAITVDAPGTYSLRITDPATGCQLDTSYLIRQDTLQPSVRLSGNQLINCASPSIRLLADTFQTRHAALDYRWTGDCLSTPVNGPVLDLACPGNVTLTVINRDNGCRRDTTFFVDRDLAPASLNLAPATAPLSCFFPERLLDGSAASSANGLRYAWIYESSPDTIGRASTFLAQRAGRYQLIVTDQRSQCSARDTIVVPADTLRPLAVTGQATLTLNCYSPTATLGEPGTSQGPEFTYAWLDPTRPADTLSQGLTLTVAPPGGLFRLTVLDTSNGCRASDSTLVRVALDTPFIRLALPLDFNCFTDSVLLDAGQTNLAFPNLQRWSGNCLPAATDTSRIWVACPGTYVYEVLNLETGCSARDSITTELVGTAVVAVLPDTAFLDCTTGETRLDRSLGTDAPVVRWFRDGIPVDLVGQRPRVTVPGVYTLVLGNFNESCLDTARTVVVADCPALAVLVPPDSLTCRNALVTLDGGPSVPAPSANVAVEWFIPAGATTQPGAGPRQLDVFTPGRYGFAIRNLISGAGDTVFVDVRRNVVQPLAEAGPRDTINCTDRTVELNGSQSVQGAEFEYLWTTVGDDTLAFAQRVTVSEPGTYLLRVTQRATGCSSVDNVTIFRDLFVPGLGFSPAELPCDTLDFALAVQPDVVGNYGYAWTGPAVLAQADRDTVRIAQPGLYTVRVTNQDNGCQVSGSVMATRAPCPPFPALPDTSLTCKSDTLRLIATFREPCVGCTYRWTRNGSVIQGQNDSSLPVTRVGDYTIIVFSAAGLRGEATGTVTDTRVLPVGNAGPDGLLTCAITSTLLVDRSPQPAFPYAYQWLNADGTAIVGATADSLRVSQGGIYQLRTTNTFSDCSIVDTVAVGYDTLRPIANAGPARILDCNNKRRVLDGIQSSLGRNFVYAWSGGPSPLCLEGASTLNPSVRCDGDYTLTVLDTVNGCSAAAMVRVDNDDELPSVVPLPDTIVNCANGSVTLQGRPVGQADRAWRWERIVSGGNEIVQEVAPGDILVTGAGDFLFTVENTLTGCDNAFSVSVAEDLQVPTVDAGISDTFYCALDSLVLRGTATTASGLPPVLRWTSDVGFFINNATRRVATVFQPDTYRFSVTDPRNFCQTVDSVVIFRDVEAPRAFAGADTTLTCTRRELRLSGDWESLSGQATFQWTTRDGRIIAGGQTLSPLINTMGRYQLNVTDPANDCSAADIVRVTNDTLPPVAIITLPQGDLVNCNRPTLLLDGTRSQPAVTYSWLGPAGDRPATPRQTVGRAGTYRLIVTDRINGCRDTTTATVRSDFAKPQIDILPPELLTCNRDTVTLTPTPAAPGALLTYRWQDATGNQIGQLARQMVGEPGTYRLIALESRNGCRDTNLVAVAANRVPPVVALAEPPVLNCFRSVATIDGSGSARGSNISLRWRSPGNSATATADPYQVRGEVPGFYYLTLTNATNGCQATDSVELLRSALAVDALELEVEQPACSADKTGDLTILGVTGGQGPFRYRVDNGLLTDRLVYEDLPLGQYRVEVVGADGCSAATSVSIVAGPEVSLDLREDTLIRLGDSLALNFVTNLASWDTLRWTSSGPLPAWTSDGPLVVRPFVSQGYRLVLVGPGGCSATDEVIIEVDETVRTFVPTAFSPNGDGQNDRLRPYWGAQVAQVLNFRIFDRWGEMVYDLAADPNRAGEDFGWDGQHGGRFLNPQVFIWQLDIELVDGTRMWESGDVVLLR